MRTALKDNGYAGVFLNEDLTKHRGKVLFEARKAVNLKSSLCERGLVIRR